MFTIAILIMTYTAAATNTDEINIPFQLAKDFIEHTEQPIFLTGKAGTGKTTFLKHIHQHAKKRMAIVAPTGVAAINAGGVTMHSFFQLPFGPYIPVANKGFTETTTIDKHSLFKNIHFNKNKITLLKELELLVIDEISMVRSDTLDAIDTILRHYRKQYNKPFGGVQMLFIGDLFQLPPVVKEEELAILQPHYATPYFFDAKVMQEAPPVYITLTKIYRQKEEKFINLLNKVRNNEVTEADIDTLNDRCDTTLSDNDGIITLTTHNAKADIINQQELQKLKGKEWRYTGEIFGDFSDKALPTDMQMVLKDGAQIMFIKNDVGEERKYYNGMLAKVVQLTKDKIVVAPINGSADIELSKEVWKNIRYTYNVANEAIEEEELGTFTQFPIRLAWAITIHKSQGLTFEKAIVDAGSSFTAGQVYVALSRCTSLDGMVLKTPINRRNIYTDERIITFTNKAASEEALQERLELYKKDFDAKRLLSVFNFEKLSQYLHQVEESFAEGKVVAQEKAGEMLDTISKTLIYISEVAAKFAPKVQQLIIADDTVLLEERVQKAIQFFSEQLYNGCLQPIQHYQEQCKYKKQLKKHQQELQELFDMVKYKGQKIQSITYKQLQWKDSSNINFNVQLIAAEKKSTYETTYELFSSGKSIAEIAAIRNYAVTTIEGHLVKYVANGQIQIEAVVEDNVLTQIIKVLLVKPAAESKEIKDALPENITYSQIKLVQAYLTYKQTKHS